MLLQLVALTRDANEYPDGHFPEHLRQLERKVGLVMTLVSTSVVPCAQLTAFASVQRIAMGSHE